jgi:hypothetical protein
LRDAALERHAVSLPPRSDLMRSDSAVRPDADAVQAAESRRPWSQIFRPHAACIVTSARFLQDFGCGSTGSRPLSVTVTNPSAVTFTSIQSAWPSALVHGVVDHLGEQVMQRLSSVP